MSTDDREPSYGAAAMRHLKVHAFGEWALAKFMMEPWRTDFPVAEAFARLRELGLLRFSWDEIELTPEQDAEAIKWAGTPEREAEARTRARARIHVDRVLMRTKDTGRQIRMCLAGGDIVFQRKDGLPVLNEDVMAALLMDERGQLNIVLDRKRFEFTIRWECDSSD